MLWLISHALGRRTTKPRAAMTAADVRAVIEAGDRFDPAAGLAFRLAAITGARRSELCALVYRDLDSDRLTIDSSIAIERSGSVIDRQVPALVDAATKTGNQRVVRLDERTVQAIETLRAERERYGPWMLQPGERPLNPERLTGWWRLARRDAGISARRCRSPETSVPSTDSSPAGAIAPATSVHSRR